MYDNYFRTFEIDNRIRTFEKIYIYSISLIYTYSVCSITISQPDTPKGIIDFII